MKFLNCDISSPSYVPMTAWLRHGPFAMWLVKAARPQRIVELGSHYGYSYFALCQAVREAGLATECIAIDTWQGDEHAGYYGEEVYQSVLRQNEPYRAFSTLVRKTFAEALADVADGSVDMLHVDGRHLYEDVKDDFESWMPKLAPNAIVLFHDTEVRERGFGVWKYWAELSAKDDTFNFVYQHGLGVLFRGQALSPVMGQFHDLLQTEAGHDAVTALFFAAGEACALDNTLIALAKTAAQGEADISAFLDGLDREQLTTEALLAPLPPGATAVVDALRKSLLATCAAQSSMAEKNDRIDNLLLENLGLRRELAYARSRSNRLLQEYLTHKLLLAASKSRLLPVADRTRARWARSAEKRDPKRSLKGIAELSDHLSDTVAQSEILATAAVSRGKFIKGEVALDPAKPDILLVTHDASWTGAPILVHNLAREMTGRYNVTIISVKKAVDLLPHMLEVSAGVLLLRDFNVLGQISSYVAKENFKFAVVNSVESRSVLPGLKQAGVPIVALMHEFASYTSPKTAFAEVLSTADFTVFSTALTLESACEATGISTSQFQRILPQGKCDVPSTTKNPERRTKEQAKLKALLRPFGSEDDFLVLGAGTVQIRKGVDLFVEVARKVLAAPQGRKVRFVWIGPGYDTDNDLAYSIYLSDQLRRAGLEDKVLILPSTPEIEYSYELCDAFLLSSRVDPLPNVCIDAMLLGRPVLCFDRASGFSEILRQGGMAEYCVADYLDPADLARRVTALIASPDLYETVSRRMKKIASEVFDMARYVRQIEQLGKEAVALRQVRDEDAATIVEADGFDPRHMLPQRASVPSRAQAARVYLETFSMGFCARRPEPGFNQHAYAEHLLRGGVQTLGRDAYAHFLQAGRPSGPWLTPVLDTKITRQCAATREAYPLRTALHIHAYFVDELQRLLRHLSVNQTRPALFVSVTNDMGKHQVERLLATYEGATDVRTVPNIGRDIGPFLTEFGHELVDGFDVIGHVHTKKSVASGSQRVVESWKRLLFENMLGGKDGGRKVDQILQAFRQNASLGLVYPSDPNLLGWTRNWQQAQNLASRLNITDLPQAFDFPVGTMFWMRAEALRSFVDLGLDWSDYPVEPIGVDATMLHALERLFGLVPLHHGFQAAVTCVPGITR